MRRGLHDHYAAGGGSPARPVIPCAPVTAGGAFAVRMRCWARSTLAPPGPCMDVGQQDGTRMQARLKLVAGLLAGTILIPASVLAEPKAEKKPAATPAAVKADSKTKAGATTARSVPKPAATTAAEPTAKAAAAAPAVPASPVPRPLPEEAQHKAHYDAAIAGVRDYALSTEDGNRIREAMAALSEGNPTRAKALRDQVRDSAGRKLLEWYGYRRGYGSAAEIRAFLAANPAWPDRGTLTQRAEEDLFESSAGPAEVKAFFAQTPPATAVGMAALAAALAADKDLASAKALAAKLWVEYDIPAAQEAEILKRIGSLLTEAE